MEDSILKDLEIYYAIEILKGNIKVEHNKEDDKWFGEYYGKVKVKVNVGLYVYKDCDNGFKR